MNITKLITITMLILLIIFVAVAASNPISFDMCKTYERDEVEYRLCPSENFSEPTIPYPERCKCVCQ